MFGLDILDFLVYITVDMIISDGRLMLAVVISLRPTLIRRQQRSEVIRAVVHYKKVVVFGEHVFVDQVHATLLWIAADLFAILDKAAKDLFTPLAFGSIKGVVVLGNVQIKEMTRWEVSCALDTSVDVCFVIVSLIGVVGVKVLGLVRWERAGYGGGGGGVRRRMQLRVLGGWLHILIEMSL
jgi:hypothetical protein